MVPSALVESRTLDLDACCATARVADGGGTVAVGTYTLQETGTRDGILYFFATASDAPLQVTACSAWPATQRRRAR